MLSGKDMYSELVKVQEVANTKDVSLEDLFKASLKLQELNIKLLHNIRANQTALMEAQGVSLRKPETEKPSEREKKQL